MADREFSQFTAGGTGQAPTDTLVGLDLSLPAADQNSFWTLNNLFSVITRNITDGALRFGGFAAPSLSGAGTGALYFDSAANVFKVSSNGGAFVTLGDITGTFTATGQVAVANGTKSVTGSNGLTYAAGALTVGESGTAGGVRLVANSGNYWNIASSTPAGNRTFYFPDSITPTTGNFLFVGTFGATVVTDWSTGLTWSNSSKQITVTASANAPIGLGVQNTSAGTLAECQVGFTANGGAISLLSLTGTGFTTSGLYKANQLYWRGTTGITEMLFALDDASTAFKFGVNNAVAASINATSTEGLVLGIASTLTGRVKLYNSAGATYTQISAGNAASSLNYILPATSPTAGQVLTAAAPSGSDVVLSWGAGGGGGAPVDATYLTLSLNGTLTNERVFTLADTTLSETDGGAGGNYSIGVNQANTFAWTAAHTHTVAIGSGSATSTSPSPFITASPTTAPGSGNYKASPSIILNGQANSGAGAFNTRYRLYTLVNDNAGAASLDVQFNNANVDATFRSILKLTQGGATGLEITGATAGSGVTLGSISSGSAEEIAIVPKGNAAVKVGSGGGGGSSDQGLYISRSISNANGSGNAHAFVDATVYSRTNGGLNGFNSFDTPVVVGAAGSAYDHYVSFQARPNASGSWNDLYGGYFVATLGASAAVTRNTGLWIQQPTMGAGATITNNYGVRIDGTTAPGTNNYSLYSDNASIHLINVGTLGLGATTTPSALLHLWGNATRESLIRFTPNVNANFVGTEWTDSANGTILASLKLSAGSGELRHYAGSSGYYQTFYANNVEALRITTAGNLCLGTTAAGTSATKTFVISSGTAPTTYPTDAVQLCSADYAAGDTRLRVYSENAALPVILGGYSVLSGRQVVAKTADYTIQIGESNTCFTNKGASGAVIFTLPPTGTVESYNYDFFRVANQSFTVQCPPGVVIRVGASASSAGGTVTLDAVGSGLQIVQVDASLWYGYTVGAVTFA